MRLKLTQAVDRDQAVTVLVQRLCHLVREHARRGTCPDLNEAASSLSLIAFGHSPFNEGRLREAARQTAAEISSDPNGADDATVMAAIARRLPLICEGHEVRELFVPIDDTGDTADTADADAPRVSINELLVSNDK